MSPASGTIHEAPPEFALLLRLLSPRGQAGGAREVIGGGGVDWGRLVRLAVHHKVLAQLHAALGGEFRDYVPEEAFRRLGGRAHDNARRNLLLTAKLLKLLSLFGAE